MQALKTQELAESISNSQEFKDRVLEMLGDLSDYQVTEANVLVATYIQPSKTKHGIIRTFKAVDEDRFQCKVGLLLKMGEFAYAGQVDGKPYKYKASPKVGDFVMFNFSDPRELGIRGVSCKMIDASLIRMIVPRPEDLY